MMTKHIENNRQERKALRTKPSINNMMYLTYTKSGRYIKVNWRRFKTYGEC